jgi:CHAD domain-containing protein
MKRTLEREIKLQAADGFRMPSSLGEPIVPRRFSSTYHDTSDHRLAAVGITLRYRVGEGNDGAWQLKLPDDSAARLELELPGRPDGVPERFGDLVAATVRGRALAPIATLETVRQGFLVRENGRELAEVVIDEVTVTDVPAERAKRCFEELEVELVDGDEDALRRIERDLRAAGAGDADTRPKVFQALGLRRDEPRPPKRKAPAQQHLVAMLGQQHRAILANDPGTRLGEDPEHLHQHRVAIRRLRALLRAARPMLDRAWVKELRDELRWAGRALGDVRDLDVMIEHLERDGSELDERERGALQVLLSQLADRRDEARRIMLAELRTPRYMKLLDRLETELGSPPVVDRSVHLEKIAGREFRRLRTTMRKLAPDSADEELHAARISVKRARYAAELAERSRGKKATAFIRAAKQLQDVLGDHQDAHVAEDVIRQLAHTALPDQAFAGGMIAERQRERRRDARAAYPAIWKELRRRGKAAWS